MSGLISDDHIKMMANQSYEIKVLKADKLSLEKQVDYLSSLNSRQSVEMTHLRKRIKMYDTRLDAFFIILGCLIVYCCFAL